MKIIFTFLVGVFLIGSCASNKPFCVIDPYSIEPEPRIVKGIATSQIYSTDKSDTSTFEIEYAYFSKMNSSNVMDSTYKDSVNALIYKSVSNKIYVENNFAFNAVSKYYFRSVLDSMAATYYEEEAEYEGGALWEMYMTIGIVDFPTFSQLTTSGWSYTGGAHGNGYMSYKMIDKESGSLLGLNDFFTSITDLNKIGEKYFRALFGLASDQNLSEYGFWFEDDTFSVNNNFTFTGEGITFYYNSYEIAPYSGGPTELDIPIEKINHLLKIKL